MSYLADIKLTLNADGLLDCEVDLATGCRKLVFDRDAVKQRLVRRISTVLGSWIADRNFGSILHTFERGPIDEMNDARAYAEVRRILDAEEGLMPKSAMVQVSGNLITGRAKFIDGSPFHFEHTLRKEG